MDTVQCPYCGHENEMEDYFESNEFDHECEECGEEFEVYVEYEPSLSASKIEYILCPICGEIKRDVTIRIPYVSEHIEMCEECYRKLSYEEFIKNKGE